MRQLVSFIVLVSLAYQSRQHELQGFDDTILFDINFPGKLADIHDLDDAEVMYVTSSMNEKYKCVLPAIKKTEEDDVKPYSGPSPLELIAPIFRQGTTCSYRLESYWTYEVCHGKYIRQYHEDREGKKVKLQEFILGKWAELHLEHLIGKTNKERLDLNPEFVAPTMRIDNMVLSYYEITMTNGTACDLNQNKPRSTIVKYVCFPDGKHEVYLLKELSTCVYEVVILTPLLCTHPKYKPKETGNLNINCVPTEGANAEPYSLTKLKRESSKLKRAAELDRLKVELVQFKSEDAVTGDQKSPKFVTNKVSDPSPVQEFLQGTHCLYGGTGWWQFEFCYGKSVEQFHIEKDGYRTSINLGMFDKEKHLEWIKEHPHKKPKPLEERKQLSHFYSGGSVCDKTGQPRQTEVKLKCVENRKSSSSVSLYLLEPKYCEYILGVESPLICEILDKADEYGLVEVPLDFDDDEGVELKKITIKL
ncbi:endoplasmic reticulum lectin 1 isoform X2 [Anthonomus grandis grandis]|uniref:endoplasmic reticulum lectin 1 isoform X2 n=1 Tax=Anthonomus grandis grandis TaxID=2921223 RepID=UPI002165AC59|nr:endoplasmic reticulum lectin 1 isoform X2 [Anthonomus grandis grandis]